ncbi:NAD(P)H-dependent oxidoreductase [Candidatus Pelagibacter sp. Uisw_114]
MKKIFLLYGHYNEKSFNAAIRDTFIKTVEANGHSVDCVDLYKEKFNPVFAGEQAGEDVLDHRRRIEKCDTIVLIAPIWNFRMPAIVEGWIDKVLSPPWAFTFKKLVGNYGYPMGNLKDKKAIIFCTYGSPRLAITTFFLNLPIRRLKRGVFHMCGIYNIVYRRYFAVPFVSDKKENNFWKTSEQLHKIYKVILITLFLTSPSFAELVKPNNGIEPYQVVKIQLRSLKQNDNPKKDNGIEQTWEFAHPNNQKNTGPLDRFKTMIKGKSYVMLLNHLDHKVVEIKSDDLTALFEVTVLDRDKVYYKFKWAVEKYIKEGLLKDCWLTTMVSAPMPLGSSV